MRFVIIIIVLFFLSPVFVIAAPPLLKTNYTISTREALIKINSIISEAIKKEKSLSARLAYISDYCSGIDISECPVEFQDGVRDLIECFRRMEKYHKRRDFQDSGSNNVITALALVVSIAKQDARPIVDNVASNLNEAGSIQTGLDYESNEMTNLLKKLYRLADNYEKNYGYEVLMAVKIKENVIYPDYGYEQSSNSFVIRKVIDHDGFFMRSRNFFSAHKGNILYLRFRAKGLGRIECGYYCYDKKWKDIGLCDKTQIIDLGENWNEYEIKFKIENISFWKSTRNVIPLLFFASGCYVKIKNFHITIM